MRWLSTKDLRTEIFVLAACSLVLFFCSLIRFKIAISPIPVSLLTFAVGLLSLSLGGSRGAIVALVLLASRLSLIALRTEGFRPTPEMGYLVGMVLSSFLIGKLSESGFANGPFRTLGILYIGSVVVLLSGAAGLSFFVPTNEILSKAVFPFLIGDLIKNVSASFLFVRISRYLPQC